MTSFDTMTETAKLIAGLAIIAALSAAGLALLLDLFGVF